MRQTRDIIVLGASAGGVEALTDIVSTLDPDLPAAVFIVLHLPASYRSRLPEILRRAGQLPARNALDNEDISHGQIFIAPPDFHLLVGGGTVHVARGPRVNRSRPAIDLLFQSASAAHGPRVIGVIASGMLDDGTRGLATIKRRGGIAIVQDPEDATFESMPRNALTNVNADHVLPAREIGQLLNRLVTEPIEEEEMAHDRPRTDMLPASGNGDNNSRDVSPFTCPECNGTLWEIEEGALVHFQCRVGHSFTPSSLISAQVDEVEVLLWSALRAMEERDVMYKQLRERSVKFGTPGVGAQVEKKLLINSQHAEMLRKILLGEESMSVPVSTDAEEVNLPAPPPGSDL